MRSNIFFVIIAYYPLIDPLRNLLLGISSKRAIVIDNGGTKPIGITNVEVLHQDKNLGYGGGANVGIERAVAAGAEWVVVVNQDVVAKRDSIDAFVNTLEKTPAGIAGPFVGSLDPKRWTADMSKKGETPYISGAFMAIHREVVDKIGYFYDPYFMYYEDADYCARARKAGFPLVGTATAGIRHDDSPSLGKGSYLHEYYLSRNHLLFVEREAPWKIKLYELSRLPKTIAEYRASGNAGGPEGVKDYFLRRFGEKKL